MRAKQFFRTNLVIATVLLAISAFFNGFSPGTRIAMFYMVSVGFIGLIYSRNKTNLNKKWPESKIVTFTEVAFPLVICATMIIIDQQPLTSAANLTIATSIMVISSIYLYKVAFRK